MSTTLEGIETRVIWRDDATRAPVFAALRIGDICGRVGRATDGRYFACGLPQGHTIGWLPAAHYGTDGDTAHALITKGTV